MVKEPVTAEEVQRAIMHRITTGMYGPGEDLPSVRDLASEIGSTRNTVNKAYQMLLELGVITSKSSGRRGFFVNELAQGELKPKQELLQYFYRGSLELVWHAMASGISADEILEQLQMAVSEVFGQGKVRMMFFECNEYDTQEMGRNLNKTLGMNVEYQLLDQLYKNLVAVVRDYDLIITTYHHLAEIMEKLKEQGVPIGKVVGIETRPAAHTMLQLARLPNTHIGLVCTNQNTAHMLKHIFFGYHPDWVIEAASVEEPDSIRAIARTCDHFLVSHTSHQEVTALTGRSPDVILNFQIDEQSITFLKQRIYDIQMVKIKSLHSIPTDVIGA